MEPCRRGTVSIDVQGIDCSPIVDKVVATLIPLGSLVFFYAVDLTWDRDTCRWRARETVVPGAYAVSVDAEVEEVWISTPDETFLDVYSGTEAAVAFRLEEMIKLGKRQFKPTLF